MNSSKSDQNNQADGQNGDQDQRLQVAADVRFRPVFDEGVVIRQRAAEVLVLNEVGTRILELLSDELTLTEITERLATEFDAPASVSRLSLNSHADTPSNATLIPINQALACMYKRYSIFARRRSHVCGVCICRLILSENAQ